MRFHHLAMIVVVVVAIARVAAAQAPTTAQEHIALAQTAFEKGDYKSALDHYQKAFALDSSPANALRVFVAATYVDELSEAATRLDTWFTKKRADAKKLGDPDDSWAIVDTATASLRGAASREEARARQLADQVDELTKQVSELQRELQEQQIVVRSVRADYEQQINELKDTFKRQLDAASTLQHGAAAHGIP